MRINKPLVSEFHIDVFMKITHSINSIKWLAVYNNDFLCIYCWIQDYAKKMLWEHKINYTTERKKSKSAEIVFIQHAVNIIFEMETQIIFISLSNFFFSVYSIIILPNKHSIFTSKTKQNCSSSINWFFCQIRVVGPMIPAPFVPYIFLF